MDERKNCTLTEMVNCMIMQAKLPIYLWGKGFYTACHLYNIIVSRKTNVCPYAIWKDRKPNLGYLKVRGV